MLKDFFKQDTDFKKGVLYIIVFILSCIATFALDIRFDFIQNTLIPRKMSIYIFPLAIIVILYAYNTIFKKKREGKLSEAKRLSIISWIYGFLISLFVVIGRISYFNYGDRYMTFSSLDIFFSKNLILYILITIIGVTIFSKNIMVAVFALFEKYELKNSIKQKEKQKNVFLSATLKSSLIVFLILIICWIPNLLLRYPGVAGFDNMYQVWQVETGNYKNDHPLLHTVLYGGLVKLGKELFGTFNSGVLLASIIKMMVAAGFSAYLLYYMAKRKVPFSFRFVLLLFLAFYPPIAQHTIIGNKDITFSMLIALLVMNLADAMSNPKEYFKNIGNIIMLFVFVTLSLFYRHNALYAYIIAVPVMLVILIIAKYIDKKKQKQDKVNREYNHNVNMGIFKIMASIILAIFTYILVINMILKGFNIPGSNVIEKYSVPAQMIGRIVKFHSDELTEEEKEDLFYFFLYDEGKTSEEKIQDFVTDYTPSQADPIKNKLDNAHVEEKEKEFLEFFFNLIKKYPLDAIQAFLSHTYLYYYPFDPIYLPLTNTYADGDMTSYNIVDVHPKYLFDSAQTIITRLQSIYSGSFPVLGLFANIAITLYVVILGFMYLIYKKRIRYLMAYIPTFAIYISILFSPIGGEIRYILPLFTTAPILIALSMDFLKRKDEEKSKN